MIILAWSKMPLQILHSHALLIGEASMEFPDSAIWMATNRQMLIEDCKLLEATCSHIMLG